MHRTILHKKHLTQRNLYTQTAHRFFYRPTLVHAESLPRAIFAQLNLFRRNIYAQKKLRTAVFTCRRFLHETPPQLESQDQQRNCHFHSATGKSMSTICSRACPRGNGLWTCAPLVCPSFPCSPPCLCAQPAHRQPHSHHQVGGAPHQRHHHPHPSSPHTLPAGIHPTC